MDAALLTDPAFWSDSWPFAPGRFDGEIPDMPELQRHVLFQTSGSSGNPKWIALSKTALLVSAACVNRQLRVTENSRWGLALPLHHVGGFGVAARAFEADAGFATFPGRWDAAVFQQWLAENSITHTSLVPAQVHDLVAGKLRAPASLTAIVVGGGRLEIPQGRAARDLGWPVLASYGMTEAGSQIATQTPDLLDSPYQCENIPLLDIWNARITMQELLEISGPALFSGSLHHENGRWNYVSRSKKWHCTSDRVILGNRTLTPLGRADSLVKILGELVDPEAIERELLALSDGKLLAGTFVIAAIPDPRAGHRLVPIFESSVEKEAVRVTLSTYEKQAPGYRRLQPALYPEVLPRSPLGKILRAEITKLAGG